MPSDTRYCTTPERDDQGCNDDPLQRVSGDMASDPSSTGMPATTIDHVFPNHDTHQEMPVESATHANQYQHSSMHGKGQAYHSGMSSLFYPSNTGQVPDMKMHPEATTMFSDFSFCSLPRGPTTPLGCFSEVNALGPLSMNGYTHAQVEEAAYPVSPPTRPQGDGGEAAAAAAQDALLEQDPQGRPEDRGGSQIKLKWKSYQEARDHRTTINSRFKPDPTIPSSDEARQAIVRGFIRAMKHAGDGSEEQQSTRPFRASKYDDEVLEMCAWNLLEMTIQRHTIGPLRTAWHDKSKGSKPYTTFMERIDAITTAMMNIKMIVKHVLDTPYVYTFIDDPEGCRKRVETNKCLNKKKAFVMSAGKQYLQQQQQTSVTPTTDDSGSVVAVTTSTPAQPVAAKPRAHHRATSSTDSARLGSSAFARPSILGSPFSTPDHSLAKREDPYDNLGMRMRQPHPCTFDSPINNIYSTSVPDGLLFSPDQHIGTPGSSVPRSMYLSLANGEAYGGMHLTNMPVTGHSTPSSLSQSLHTPLTMSRDASGAVYQDMPPDMGGPTVSPSSLMLIGGGSSAPSYPYAAPQHRNVSTPPQLSPRKRGFDVSGTWQGQDYPSQRRAV